MRPTPSPDHPPLENNKKLNKQTKQHTDKNKKNSGYSHSITYIICCRGVPDTSRSLIISHHHHLIVNTLSHMNNYHKNNHLSKEDKKDRAIFIDHHILDI